MGTLAAIVLVFPLGKLESKLPAHPDVFEDAEGAGLWRPRGLADARLSLEKSPMSFEILQLTFNSNELAREPGRPGLSAWKEKMQRLGTNAGADFGYLSRYEYQWETRWIENEILGRLLSGDLRGLNQHGELEEILIPAKPDAAEGSVPGLGDEANAQIVADVRGHLCGSGKWEDRDTQDPHDGLLMAIRGSDPERPHFVRALMCLLLDPDLRVRTGVVACLREVGGDMDLENVVENVSSHEDLFHAVKPAWPIEHSDLEAAVALAVARHARAGGARVLGWLEQLAERRSWGWYLLEDLARLDPDWVLAHSERVEHDNLAVLAALPANRRAELIARLAPWPPEKPTSLTRSFWSRLPAEEADRLRALMWPKARG